MSCDLCEQIDPNLPNTTNAKNLGVAESTIRRHKAHMTDAFFSDIPVHAITQRRTTRRLPDGSYERVTWSPAKAVAELVSYDDIADLFTQPLPAPPTTHGPQARVLCLADWQLGKTASGGGSQETIQRVRGAYARVADMLFEHPVHELVITDLGDITEGFQNTPSQAQTNDLDQTTQLRVARRLLAEGIKQLAPLAPVLTFVSVPSNHGQVRAEGSKSLATTVDNDWGLELHEMVKDVISETSWSRRVRFVRPSPFEESVTHNAGGACIGFTHGHRAGRPEKMADWWAKQSHGRIANLHNADYLLYGHFHNLRIQQSGDERWLIGAPSADVGSDWFVYGSGERATAGTLTFMLDNGKWSGLEIL